MASLQFTLDGSSEAAAAMRRLADEVSDKLLRGAAAAGAAVLKAEVAQRAPVYQGDDARIAAGTLKAAVAQFFVPESSGPDRAVYGVKPLSGFKQQFRVRGGKRVSLDAFYWQWVEFGHKLVPRTGKGGASLRKRRSQAEAIRASVPPRPFLRPAFEAKKTAAQSAMQKYLERNLNKAIEAAKR